MSFYLTTPQVRAREKTVTRRIGWWHLKPGDRVVAVEKAQGLKKGEKVKAIAVLEIVAVRKEPIRRMIDDLDYGFEEVELEGFGDHPTLRWPTEWVRWFCESHSCDLAAEVNRIEFRYVEDGRPG